MVVKSLRELDMTYLSCAPIIHTNQVSKRGTHLHRTQNSITLEGTANPQQGEAWLSYLTSYKVGTHR